jgi:hypothetical protein
MNLASVMAELRADPEAFLRHYVVTIVGGNPNLAQPFERRALFQFQIANTQDYTGFQTGLAGLLSKTKNRPVIKFVKVAANSAAAAGNDVIEVWYVPMAQQTTRMANRHTLLPGTDGPDIAFTSQMSGCTFSVGVAGTDGARIVAHIQPPRGAQPTAADYRAMRGAASLGDMENYFDRESRPGATSYGNPMNRATIIGVRRQGGWFFYAQTYNSLGRRLHSVEQLTS